MSHCGYRVNKPTCFPTDKEMFLWIPFRTSHWSSTEKTWSGILRRLSPVFTVILAQFFITMYLNIRKTCLCANILCFHSSIQYYTATESLICFKQSPEFGEYKCEKVTGPAPKKEKEITWLVNVIKHKWAQSYRCARISWNDRKGSRAGAPESPLTVP